MLTLEGKCLRRRAKPAHLGGHLLLEELLLISILCLVSLMYYGIPYLILHVWLKQPLPSLPLGGFHGVE
jgi:hypothetical protein